MEDSNDKKKRRGRPKGSGMKESTFKHYNPRRWDPLYDLIVIGSISGQSNEELGRLYGYTKQHISNILSTSQAAEIKERVRTTIDKEYEGTIKEKLSVIGNKVISKMEAFMDREDLSNNSPFQFIDRAIKIGQVVGTFENDSSNGISKVINQTQNNIAILSSEQANKLTDAIAKSIELDSIRVGDIVKDRDISNNKLVKVS